MNKLVVAALLAIMPPALRAADPKTEDPPGRWDNNGDSVITREEAEAAAAKGMSQRLEVLDVNKDGTLTQEEIREPRAARRSAVQEKLQARFKESDKNGDGGLSREEFERGMPRLARRFDELDRNKDGAVSQEELQAHRERMHVRRRHR